MDLNGRKCLYILFFWGFFPDNFYLNKRKSEQAHIPHALKLLESAAHNECQCHALVMGIRTENHNRILVIIRYT